MRRGGLVRVERRDGVEEEGFGVVLDYASVAWSGVYHLCKRMMARGD